MKASVIIPAYNESKNIMKVIEKVGEDYEIIVVDDGSEKNICPSIKKHVSKCIHLERNMGKGYACRQGVKHASCEKIIFIDGDSQLDPSQIPKFVSMLDKYDIVLGYRKKKDLPVQRMISNMFASLMIFLSTGKAYNDVLCGFRAIKKDRFSELGLLQNRYEFESEFVIKASRKKMHIGQTPVSVRYNKGGMRVKESLKVAFYQVKEFFMSCGA